MELTTAAAAAVGAAAGGFVCGRCFFAAPAQQSSGTVPMHDGAATIRWNQSDPRPLPPWAAPERAKHEELIRRAFRLANEAVDNGNCPYAGRK